MYGLTTIAALPTAAVCKAEQIAEQAPPNVHSPEKGGVSISVDLAGSPDSFAIGLMSDCIEVLRGNLIHSRARTNLFR